MAPKFGKRFAMNAAALTRNAVAAMVERHERLTGSRMTAYHMVAQSIGTSAEWVRSYISRNPRTKEPSFTIGLNIISAYERLCNRVERIVEQERSALNKLKDDADAVATIVGRVADAQGAEMVDREKEGPVT